MTGNTLTRSAGAISQMLIHPTHAIRWIDWATKKWSPLDKGLPWTSWHAIDYLHDAVRPGWRVFEWGGGGSTLFFLRQKCHVTTVESSDGWRQRIREAADAEGHGDRLVLRHIAAESREPAAVQDYIRSVTDGAPWDLILVDGLEEDYISRVDCIRHVAANPGILKKSGLLVLDDAWRPEYEVIPEILPGWKHVRYRSLGPARLGVTQTDVLSQPA